MSDLLTRSFDLFSDDRRFRYVMGHIWDEDLPALCSCALNSSKGSKDKNDPTNTRLQVRAMAMNLGGVIYVNGFPFVSSSPKEMMKQADPFGDRDLADSIILKYAANNFLLCGWGNHGTHMGRDQELIHLFTDAGIKMHALKITTQGQPWHPLYLSYDTKPFEWRP